MKTKFTLYDFLTISKFKWEHTVYNNLYLDNDTVRGTISIVSSWRDLLITYTREYDCDYVCTMTTTKNLFVYDYDDQLLTPRELLPYLPNQFTCPNTYLHEGDNNV